MSEKNNVKEEVKNNVVDESKNEQKIIENEVVDEYAISAFDDDEADSGVSISTSEELFVTKYPVQKVSRPDGKGGAYENYAIAFITHIGGNACRNVLRICPNKKGGKALRSIASTIMSAQGEHKLEILKRTFRDNKTNATNSVYSMQISCLTDEGVPFICPLTPVGEADKAIFELFKKQLIARGDIK